MKKIILWLNLLVFSFTGVLHAQVSEEEHPVVILGSGVAAMTAATYLARGGISPVIITGPFVGGTITQSHNVQNWPGEMSISGLDLMEKMQKQAEINGALFLTETVISVDLTQRPFTITTKKVFGSTELGKKYKAHSLIIALGATPKLLNIPGESDKEGYWSRGVYSCAICDGSLYKDKVVAVVGGGDSALTEAQYLSNLAKKVHIFVRRNEFRTIEKERLKEILNRSNVEVHYNTTIQEIKGDHQKVTHLVVQGVNDLQRLEIPVDALFLGIGANPNSSLFKGQLELDDQGYIVLKNHQETSIEGVYAAGDIADAAEFKQAVSAAGDAAKAALQAQKYLASFVQQKAMDLIPIKTASHEVIDVTSKQQLSKQLSDSNGVVFVDFYSTHCGPCRMFSPLYDGWAKNFGDRITFLKINADKAPEIFDAYQIRVVPTLLIFDEQGNVVRRSTGFKEISEVDRRLEKVKGKSELSATDFKD